LPSPAASIPEITDGDRVRVEVSPYDLNRGRIVYRDRWAHSP
jgi:translation initiation factor IF-1